MPRSAAEQPTRSVTRARRRARPSNATCRWSGLSPLAGRSPVGGAGAFERAWRADHRNVAVAEQLVHIHHASRTSEHARMRAGARYTGFARFPRPARGSDRCHTGGSSLRLEAAHEDFGRRLTVSLDAWSRPRVGTWHQRVPSWDQLQQLLPARNGFPARKTDCSRRQTLQRCPHHRRRRRAAQHPALAELAAWRCPSTRKDTPAVSITRFARCSRAPRHGRRFGPVDCGRALAARSRALHAAPAGGHRDGVVPGVGGRPEQRAAREHGRHGAGRRIDHGPSAHVHRAAARGA